MCQLFGMSSRDPVSIQFSWKRFAMRGSEDGGNPDGWGVAYLDQTEVHLVREPTPAADSSYVAFLEAHGPASDTIISHIRRGERGGRILANTQPFVRRLGGRTHVFAHNGFVAHAECDASPWLRPTGQTDSEALFCSLLAQLEPLWAMAEPPSRSARAEVIAAFAETMRPHGAVNFLYSDGLTLFAHAHRKTLPGEAISTEPGLYVLDAANGDNTLPYDCVDCADRKTHAVIVATMPLDNQNWRAMGCGELAMLERGEVVES